MRAARTRHTALLLLLAFGAAVAATPIRVLSDADADADGMHDERADRAEAVGRDQQQRTAVLGFGPQPFVQRTTDCSYTVELHTAAAEQEWVGSHRPPCPHSAPYPLAETPLLLTSAPLGTHLTR